MTITHLFVKNFRCFSQFSLSFASPLVLITGANGSGKTSLLEALHFSCYLRSFRASTPKDLFLFDTDNFLVKVGIQEPDAALAHEIHIGVTGKNRLIKMNQQEVQSYKELSKHYRVVTITQDDVELVSGAPAIRRLFMDQALALLHDGYMYELKRYRHILENRNALLRTVQPNKETYSIWTEQLWHQWQIIMHYRLQLLMGLEERVLQLTRFMNIHTSITLAYRTRFLPENSFDAFMHLHTHLYEQEMLYQRSLFGAHLDDVTIQLFEKTTKTFASRGQQKLVVLLIKIALAQELIAKRGAVVMLLDDFMNDFDPVVGQQLLHLLTSLSGQLIFTSPMREGLFEQDLHMKGAQHITLP